MNPKRPDWLEEMDRFESSLAGLILMVLLVGAVAYAAIMRI